MQEIHLNLEIFIQDILNTLGENNNDYLKSLIEADLAARIVETISLNTEAADLYYLNLYFPHETQPEFIYSQIIAQNPNIQASILNLLDAFKKEMIENARVKT